tara:strand:+ start:1609 stop:2376 length:768 start_codon:yes stop_codon:yes gene_type:complete
MENIGIYKWTSPKGRVYIGQSKNLKQRQSWYASTGLQHASMPKLKRSFNKYGIENHTYEVIEYCNIDDLDKREIYWGLYYNTLNEGLNCKLGEQNSIFSESTKNKMSLAKQGFKLSPSSESKRQASLRKTWDKKNLMREEKKQNKPKYTFTKEHKENISKSVTGISKHTPESKQKLSTYGKNRDMVGVVYKGKEVIQYDKAGNFIKEWESANSAEMFLKGRRGDNIGKSIRHFNKTGVQRKAYGFIWKFKKQLGI